MEASILVYAVTISWIYLAYSTSKPVLKELLHLIVIVNIVSTIYLIVAVTGNFEFTNYVEGAEIYLMGNLFCLLAFLFFYLIEWIKKYIKERKRKEDIGNF